MKLLSTFAIIGLTVSSMASNLKSNLSSDDPAIVRSAIEICKQKGKEALPDLRKWSDSKDARLRLASKRALGAITGQWGSQTDLIWEKDFKTTVKKAQEQKKPILVLQLFGNLNEEFC